MNLEKVHPQLQKTYGRIPPVPFHSRVFLTFVSLLSVVLGLVKKLLVILRGPRETPGLGVTERKLVNAGVRVYQPEGASSGAGLLWIHGGGFVVGDAASSDSQCAAYARDLNLTVVSVEYRLAPRYPFPCAMDDCFEAWQWFQDNSADLGVSPERIVISGQSAGGGLAAGLAQRVFDHGGVQPAGQALFYPMLDDRTAARTELDAVKHRLWNNRNNRGGWSYYLGQAPGLPEVPAYAAPARRQDLAGLPTTWIGVGDIDLFYAEDCEYAERLGDAGVRCQLEVVPAAPHAFELFVADAPISIEFMQSNYQFLRQVLNL